MYTFLGNKDFILKEFNKIKKDYNDENIIVFDGSICLLEKVLEELDTFSMFGKKLIRVDDFDKFEDFSLLIKYLDNPSDNTLVLVSYKELDKRKKITKILEDKTKVFEFFDYDLTKYVKSNLDGFKMSFMDINLLINYCNDEIDRIDSELSKLKLFKYEEKEITLDDIKKLVKRSYDSTIFNLIDSINSKDKDRVYSIYKELLEEGETDEKIMYTLANHYRLLFRVLKELEVSSDREVMDKFKFKPYRLTKLKEQVNLVGEDRIISIIKTFGDIDIEYKAGLNNIDMGLFMFFQNL